MSEKVGATEARQGDRRRMNMRVLFWSLPAAAVLLALVAAFWVIAA